VEKSYSLRETINTNFDQFRQHADAVILEFGSSRERDLALRAQLQQWQFQLRMVFITRIALLKYRLQLPGFALPAPVQTAQVEFDDRQAAILDEMADRLAGKTSRPKEGLRSSLESLERAAQQRYPDEPPEQFATQLTTFLPLSRRSGELIDLLDKEI
jgi:multidrug resistance protein MdtO